MKKPTVKDVAREAGVSTATVSRVLNGTGYVSEAVRAHVLRVVERLNYRPNSIARDLKKKRTDAIGLVVPDMTNPYFMTIARHIRRKCLAHGYHLLLMDSEEDAEKEGAALDLLSEKRVEAIVLAGTGANRETLDRLRADGTALVLIDRRIEGTEADLVCEDNAGVSARAVAELLDRGHERIGIIAGPNAISTARERLAGAEAALRERGLPPESDLVFPGDFTRNSGRRAARAFMDAAAAPTAVFSCNNEMTYGFYLGLKEAGVDSEAIEVVSFGDLEFSPLFRHRLTVVRQDPAWVGDTAAETVLSRLRNPRAARSEKVLVPAIERKY